MILNGTLSHCTGNGNIFFSPPPKYFLSLDLPNEGIFQKLNVAVQFHRRRFCSMNILTKEEKWPFLLLFLSVCGAAVGPEILITIRQRLICLPPPVKKSNNYIIQPSYTTDAQKCDKTLLRKRNQVLRSLDWVLLRTPQIARVAGRTRSEKRERGKKPGLHNIQNGGDFYIRDGVPKKIAVLLDFVQMRGGGPAQIFCPFFISAFLVNKRSLFPPKCQ